MIEFFIKNARMNYMLFFLIVVVGVYSYIKIPKEVFPSFDLDMISISGHYSGASLDVLDKMAVKPLEDELTNIDGIKELTTVISPGGFTIVIELESGVDKYNTADKVKDALAVTKKDLPADMDEPVVKVMDRKRDLLNIAMESKTLPIAALKLKAQKLKEQISAINYISEVTIYGDSDLVYEIELDTQKIQAYDLSTQSVVHALSRLSYIFPMGKIEDTRSGFFYLSTNNGGKSQSQWENMQITIEGKRVYLKDIAYISKHYEDAQTLFAMNGKNALNLTISQDERGNAIDLSKSIEAIVYKFNQSNPEINAYIHDDDSQRIVDRLNVVISNILLGIIIITLLVAWLINMRMAFIIMLGIPTSFLIGVFYLYIFGYSINMISLIGVLIALGIIVDDAIVVSENIQQYLEKGMSATKAAIVGTKEMAMPVIIASLTTLFAFIPALLISGRMGEVMKLIPIAVSVLVIASLLESFIFLPIHAAHTLEGRQKTYSWEKWNRIYSLVLHSIMHHKKSFLITFVIIVPLLTFWSIKSSRFQMFPQFDSKTIHIALKADVNTSLKQTDKILKKISQDLHNKRDAFSIQYVSSIAGYRRDNASNVEYYPYVGDITLELQKIKPINAVDKYITPYLSFYYDDKNRTREKVSDAISKDVAKFLEQGDYKAKYHLKDLSVVQKKVGPIKADIKIGLISEHSRAIIGATDKLLNALDKMDGIVNITSSAEFGVDEIKIQINSYGVSLGIDEATIGEAISNLYLSRKIANTFNKEGLLEIKVQSFQKDNLEKLKALNIGLDDGTFVALKDVVDFKVIKAFEKVTKDKGMKNFYLFANVDPKILTAQEAIKKIEPILKEIERSGIKIVQKGEQEQKDELSHDLISASLLAFVLIMLSMLYLFNSFRETFMLLSVIPFSFLGAMLGHKLLGINIGMPSLIGILGLAGVVVNDGIIMISTLKFAKSVEDIFDLAGKRLRPIMLTSLTTLLGLATLIFFASGEAVIFQPLAIALGFGLAWGTILNLIYLPVLYTYLNQKRLCQRAPAIDKSQQRNNTQMNLDRSS